MKRWVVLRHTGVALKALRNTSPLAYPFMKREHLRLAVLLPQGGA